LVTINWYLDYQHSSEETRAEFNKVPPILEYLYYHSLIFEEGRDRATDRKNMQERMKVAMNELSCNWVITEFKQAEAL
jgi:hypothetical protein